MIAKKFRLSKKSDFSKLVQSSNKFYSSNFVLKFIKDQENLNHFAVVVSKKISLKAVVRNKIRRRIYELLRLNMSNFKLGFKIIIFVKKSILELKYQEIEKELLDIFKKAKLI